MTYVMDNVVIIYGTLLSKVALFWDLNSQEIISLKDLVSLFHSLQVPGQGRDELTYQGNHT